MTEQEFLDSIDCNFSYDDIEKAKELIDQGRSISLNADFAVLEEILRPPQNRSINETLHKLWKANHDSAVYKIIKPAVNALIQKKELTPEKALDCMTKLKEHPHQYCALNIVYFSTNADERVKKMNNEIRTNWNTNA